MDFLRDLSLFWSMAHVTVLFLMLFRSKYKKHKTVIISTSVIGFLMAVNIAGLAVFGLETMGRLILITCSIPSFILFYILSSDKNFSYLFTFCLADTVCLWILGATNLLDHYLGGGRFVLMFVLRLIAFPLLEYVVYKKFRAMYAELQNVIKKGWGAYAGMTVVYYILLLVMSEIPTHINTRPEYFLSFALVLVLMVFNYAIIFASLYRQYKLYESEKAESLLREQKQSLENKLENQEHIRRLRHDMRGHTITLQGLLRAGNNKEAIDYLESMERSIASAQDSVCADPYLNAQLTHYIEKFKELDMVLETDIKLGNMQLPHTQVCSMISNGLENALNASKKLPPNERQASVQMKYKKDYLVIRIRNKCSAELKVERGRIPKTEKSGKDHGIGLLSIKETAEKLGGDMVCYTENNCFVLDIMIQAGDGENGSDKIP